MKCLFIVFNKLKIKKRKILFLYLAPKCFGTQTLRHPNAGTQTLAPKRRHPTAGTQTSRTVVEVWVDIGYELGNYADSKMIDQQYDNRLR